MREYKVNRIKHTVYDSVDELPPDIIPLKSWRDGDIGDWVLTDDDCIIQILRKGKMLRKNKTIHYLGTCTGTFTDAKNTKMDTDRRPNIYSFGGYDTLGINETTIISNINNIALSSEKDETRLKALFKLSDIMDLEDKNTAKVQQITGVQFQGFDENMLDSAERPKKLNG